MDNLLKKLAFVRLCSLLRVQCCTVSGGNRGMSDASCRYATAVLVKAAASTKNLNKLPCCDLTFLSILEKIVI